MPPSTRYSTRSSPPHTWPRKRNLAVNGRAKGAREERKLKSDLENLRNQPITATTAGQPKCLIRSLPCVKCPKIFHTASRSQSTARGLRWQRALTEIMLFPAFAVAHRWQCISQLASALLKLWIRCFSVHLLFFLFFSSLFLPLSFPVRAYQRRRSSGSFLSEYGCILPGLVFCTSPVELVRPPPFGMFSVEEAEAEAEAAATAVGVAPLHSSISLEFPADPQVEFRRFVGGALALLPRNSIDMFRKEQEERKLQSLFLSLPPPLFPSGAMHPSKRKDIR